MVESRYNRTKQNPIENQMHNEMEPVSLQGCRGGLVGLSICNPNLTGTYHSL